MLSTLQWRNEWRLQSRNPLLWIALAVVGAFSLVVADGSPCDPGSDAVSALLRINLFIPAFMLPFLAAALGPLFYLREADHGMEEMFGAYPLTARQWLGMRLGNFVLLLIGACLLAQLGFVAVLAGEHPGQWPAMLGYSALWLILLHTPSCLIWASGLAWLACRKANSGYLYAAGGLGWVGYLALASLTGIPLIAGSDTIFPALKQAMLLLDPYAATAMINAMPESGLLQWREANVLAGRLLWLSACFFLLRRIKDLPSHADRALARLQPTPSGSNLWSALDKGWMARIGRSHIAMHLRYLVRDRIFFLLVGGWIALLLPEAYAGTDYAEELSRVVPDSRDALNRVVWDVLPMAGALLLFYAADRICRMYQATRMQELYAATPHRPFHFLLTQLFSLWSVAGFFMGLAGLSIAAAQLLAGSAIQPGEYLMQLGLSLPVWLLLCMLFVVVHGLVRQRFLANLLCLFLVVLGFTSLAPGLGLDHPLWRPLFTPLSKPDHYWGFDGSLYGHFAYLKFWTPLCIGLILLAVAGHNRTLPFIQTKLRSMLRSPAVALAMAPLAIAAWQGSKIDETLRNEGLLVAAEKRASLRADYERRYAHWAKIAQPDVEAISSQVDFYTRENRVRLSAQMRLINRGATPIEQVLIGRNRLGEGGTAMLRDATILRHDTELGQTVYKLDRPLRAGETLELRFAISLAQSGLEPASFPLVLRRSFSSVPADAILPVVGFKRELTLRDAATRKQVGLPELKLPLPSQLPPPTTGSLLRSFARLDAIVSTDAGHHAIAQGDLVKSWRSGGRSYFQYRSDGAIRNLPAFFAVPWRPQIWNAGSLKIEGFTPSPLAQSDANILGARDTLLWLSRDVAPYRGTAMRMVAIPDIGPSGYANPQIVQISHRRGFRAKPREKAGFSQVYRRAAHETAHQWFGHLLGHGIPDENAFLVESLAKYAELVMVERRYGTNAMHALVRFERERYRQARLDPARPIMALIDAEESEDMYSRASLVFACLRTKVGDEAIENALRRLAVGIRENATPVRSIDFVDTLKSTSGLGRAHLIDELLIGTKPLDKALVGAGCQTGGANYKAKNLGLMRFSA